MRLLYFTNTFPSGKATNWKSQELEVFQHYFSSIVVVPFMSDPSGDAHVVLPESIRVTAPLVNHGGGIRVRMMFKAVLASKHKGLFFSEFFKFSVYKKKSTFISWLLDSYQMALASESPVLAGLLSGDQEGLVWYFYWGRGPALIIPFLKRNYSANIVCRFHGYDLYKERSQGYIPYQSLIITHTDLLLPCSADGYSYLVQNFKLSTSKIFVARLGTRLLGKAKLQRDGVLKIVSCSFCVPVKRLYLILDSLASLKIPFCWTHVGDGPLFETLKERAQLAPYKDRVKFLGYLESNAVLPFYLRENFDVFINVSESEGVPVSIMEALSVGLPVIATDVGGTRELVDNKVGMLISKNITTTELALILEEFSHLSADKIHQLREEAVKRFNELCNADSNATLLAEKINSFF